MMTNALSTRTLFTRFIADGASHLKNEMERPIGLNDESAQCTAALLSQLTSMIYSHDVTDEMLDRLLYLLLNPEQDVRMRDIYLDFATVEFETPLLNLLNQDRLLDMADDIDEVYTYHKDDHTDPVIYAIR